MRAKITVKYFVSFIFIFFLFSNVHAQITVEGRVTSEDDGEPLPGVNITVQNTTRGTTTNANGYYKITVPEDNDILVFSFVGYETQEIEVNGRNEINVVMSLATVASDELVVVGYGVQRKSDLTGSVSSVSGEDLTDIPTASVTDALQGKVAGVRIAPVDGRPGAQPEVRVRGVGTLNNASPLYVVDGMLLDDISFLDSRDIESVEVLKDASAASIYGARAANGVIIISTKKGRAGETQINIRSSYGFQQIANKLDLANAREFATLVNESASNVGDPPIFDNPDQFGEGTDWQELIFRDAAPIRDYHIGISGGTDEMTYNVSTNYFRQDGIVKGSHFQRASLRLNNEYFPTDNITFGHNITFTYRDSESEGQQPIITQALRADPTTQPFDENGDYFNTTINGGTVNPVASQELTNPESFGFFTTGNAFAEIDFLENFHLRSSFALNLRREEDKVFVPEFNISPLQQNPNSRLNVEDRKTTNWVSENTLNYLNEWGDHRINLLGGITFEEWKFENLGGSRINFPGSTPEFHFLNAGEEEGQTNFNSSEAWGYISYLSRLNYVYKDRYMFTATIRRDGSSRFTERNRWGNFPSAALGWVISNEPFFEDVSYVSFLKLRGSWGLLGNDKIRTDAATPTVEGVTAVFGENEDIHTGRTLTTLANPDLRWEETEQVDIGLELNFLDDRLTTEVDWYRRLTSDILVPVEIPASVGANPSVVNAADVLNRGIDFSIRWRDSREDLSYSIGFNGSTVHNEVKALGEGLEDILDGNTRNLGFTTRTVVGEPIGSFYGYKIDGVFQDQAEIDNSPSRPGDQPGDLKLVDLNGDGTIDSEDQTFLGSPIPDFAYGISLAGSYRNFDLSMDFDGQTGNKILNARLAIRGFRVLNYDAAFLDRWTGPGTSNSEPRITESGNNYETDRFLEDGDFLRLRNVRLGYRLPDEILEPWSLRRVRIFANATNLFTNTDFNGYNPQVGSGNVTASNIAGEEIFPIARSYTFGIEVDF